MAPVSGLGTRTFDEWVDEAARQWPSLQGARPGFAEFLLARLPREALPGGTPRLALGDLFLVHACLQGHAEALQVLSERYWPSVPAAVKQVYRWGDLESDVGQILWEKLVTGTTKRSGRLGEYRGEGPLVSWLCAAALREAHALVRGRLGERPLIDAQQTLERELASGDVELEVLRSRFWKAFPECFRAAFESLTSSERNLLRLHYVGGVDVDRLARMYVVHRATAYRWLSDLRVRLAAETRRELSRRVEPDHAALESLLRAVGSPLLFSMRRLLMSPAG